MASGEPVVNVDMLPTWIQNGAVNTISLTEEVTMCAKKLSSQLVNQQKEGALNVYSLIMTVWSLDTHLARDAADLVCDEIRFVVCLLGYCVRVNNVPPVNSVFPDIIFH